MSRPILAEYARAGLVLVPIPAGLKSPVIKEWQTRERCVSDPETAEFLDGNVGLAHAYSGTVCLDIDDMSKADEFFSGRGVSLAEWLNAPDAVGIVSGREGRAKLLYRGPVLPSFNLKMHGFELRCGTNTGTTAQDVLPPSIHPETGNPYVWGGRGDWRNIPQMPAELRELWEGLAKRDTKPARERAEKRMGIDALAEAVAQNDPDAGYDDWLKVGMAIHYETEGSEEGFDIWDRWSSTGSKYKGASDLESHWRSFRLDNSNPVTAASLRVDKPASRDEFKVITQEQVDEAMRAMAAEAKTTAATSSASGNGVAEQLAKLDRDKGGFAYPTLSNVMAIMSIPEVCKSFISFDEFKSELMVSTAEAPKDWRPLRDTDYTAVRLWLENEAMFHPTSKEIVRDTLHYIGEQNKMDSAQLWLTSLKWDGVERIKDFMPKYMGTLDAAYERSVGVYLWTAMAGRVMEPGCQVDMSPILVGRAGIGKSQGIKAMVPDLSFYAEVRLDEKDDDIARKLRGVLIGEIAELRGLRTGDAERILAFMTRTHEKWTPKYMEHSTTFARRLVMIGTTNEVEFLSGDTGERRWLPVRTVGVNVPAIKRDMEQLWAEAYELWLSGGIVWRKAEVMSKEAREEFESDDPWTDSVQNWLNSTPAPHYTTADVLMFAVGVDARQVSKAHEMRLGRVMRKLNYERVQKRVNGRSMKVWIDREAQDLLT